MTGRKKLLFLEYFSFMGGGQAVLLNIIKEMKKYYDVEVLIFNRGLIEQELKKLGVRTHYIQAPLKVKYRYIWKYQPFYNSVKVFLKRGGYDLVYSGGMFATKLAGPACLAVKIPLIWHKQLIIEKGYFSYNASQARLLSNFASKIICVSEASRLSMARSGVKESKLITVHNGIKIPVIKAKTIRHAVRKKYAPAGGFVCGTVCVFRKNKGIDLLIQAASLAQKGSRKIKFLLVGKSDPGQERFEEELRRDVKDRGLDNFIFTGYRDKYDIMPAFDLYVMPSPNEPFGLVTIEAMALGIPAAGFGSGGTKEIITDGYDGFLASGVNAQALAEKIFFAYDNRAELKKMGKNAIKTVKERFTLEEQMKEIKRIIEEQW
jgi:glycosyltransferase involved in cell wall biosynthesis